MGPRCAIEPGDLAQVETITFDAPGEIYRYCFFSSDGETHEFDIRSLEGVAHCVNLRRIQTFSILNAIDVDHLVGLDKLEQLSLPDQCRHPERLLDLPALKRLSFYPPSIPDAALIAKSQAKGIRIPG